MIVRQYSYVGCLLLLFNVNKSLSPREPLCTCYSWFMYVETCCINYHQNSYWNWSHSDLFTLKICNQAWLHNPPATYSMIFPLNHHSYAIYRWFSYLIIFDFPLKHHLVWRCSYMFPYVHIIFPWKHHFPIIFPCFSRMFQYFPAMFSRLNRDQDLLIRPTVWSLWTASFMQANRVLF
jgi:hypothetical protein